MDYQSQYKYLQPIFKLYIKGKDLDALAKTVGCGKTSIYAFIGGKVPNKSRCRDIIEEGLKMLESKGVNLTEILKQSLS